MEDFAEPTATRRLDRVRREATLLTLRRHHLWLGGTWVLGVLVLAPAIGRPTLSIELIGVLVAVYLAWKSVAYPLAAAGIPPLVDAIVGSDPLPKGGFTFIFGAWITLGVFFAIVRRKTSIPSRALMSVPVLFSFGLLGLMLLRLGASPAESYGSIKMQLYIADVLIAFIGAIFVGSCREDLDIFLLATFAILAGGAFLFSFNLVTGNAHALIAERFSLTAQEYPIYLARDSADGLLIAIYLILAATRVRVRLLAIAATPTLIVAMIAAGSRGPVVAFVFGFVALIALVAANGRARRRLAFVAGVLLVSIVVVPLVVPGSSIGRSLSTILGSSSGLSSNGRSELWALALNAFNQHPLAGVGWGGFSALSTELYPHNILLEVSAELGILGVIFVVGIVVSAVMKLVDMWRIPDGGDKLVIALIASLLLTAFVNALFSGSIQDNSEIWLWTGLVMGMATLNPGRRWPTGMLVGKVGS